MANNKHPALRSSHLDRSIHHRRQHVFERQACAERTRHIQQHAQMVQLARSGGRRRGPLDLLHQLFDRRSLTQVDELVGIGHAEIDFVAGLQFVLQHFFAVDECAVAAAHVFEHPPAIYGKDLCLLPADPAIAKGKFVAGLPADSETARRSGAHRGERRSVQSQQCVESVAWARTRAARAGTLNRLQEQFSTPW